LLQHICLESSKHSISLNPNKPFNLTIPELKKYIGICVVMSVNHLSNVRNYWSEIMGNKLIQETMSVNHFDKIRSILHFNDNTFSTNNDRLHKIRPVLETLKKKNKLRKQWIILLCYLVLKFCL
jgi:hypothetical protein